MPHLERPECNHRGCGMVRTIGVPAGPWCCGRCGLELRDDELDRSEVLWESIKRAGVRVVRCRWCGFETYPFADATIDEHMKTCPRKAPP